jgi:hypothetical protein
MHHMSERGRRGRSRLLLGLIFAALSVSPASAGKLDFSRTLDAYERLCLDELIHASSWGNSPEFWNEMSRNAEVARADLNSGGHKDYFYLFEDRGWCGTGGCPLLIGEAEAKGTCRLLYDDAGFDNITVLQRRDNGYRRLYTPCEVRFDGKQYHQLHPECPTVNIQR